MGLTCWNWGRGGPSCGHPTLDNIRHGSHTLGANQDLSGKEDASADQQAIVSVGDLIASNVTLSRGLDYRRRVAMKRTTLGVILGMAVALLLVGSITLSQAAGPAGMKLYAFSSGGLTIAKSALQSGAPST